MSGKRSTIDEALLAANLGSKFDLFKFKGEYVTEGNKVT